MEQKLLTRQMMLILYIEVLQAKEERPWLLREVPKRKGSVSIANFIRLIFQEA